MKEAARQGKRLPSFVPSATTRSTGPPSGRPQTLRDFAINAEEANLVRRVFDLYEQHSEGRVARMLNDDGVRWPVKNPGLQAKFGGRTERPFTGVAIHDIVHNELYAGFVTWGKDKRSRHLRDFETARVFRPDLQIVSLEQWTRIERIREERKRVPPRSVSSPFLFSGLVKCRFCRGALTGVRKRNKTSPQYSCNARSGGGPAACPGQSVSESVARAAAVHFLQVLFAERIALEPFIESTVRRFDDGDETLVREAQAELRVLEQQKRNLIDAVASGFLRHDDIRAKTVELEDRRERLDRRLVAAGGRQELRADLAAAVRLLEEKD
jgi:site-specific DNA recombinase